MVTLIVGGTGFIGLNIAEAHLKLGHKVILLDKGVPPDAARATFDSLPGSWIHLPVDVTDPPALETVFKDHPIDRIFYGAAITSGPERERHHPDEVIRVNLLGLTHVIKAAARAGVRRMINISSGAAYGEGGFATAETSAPIDEYDTRPLPATLYSTTKLASEGVCRRLAVLSSLDLFSVRLAIIFGPWERNTGSRDTLSAPMQAGMLALRGEVATVERRDSRDWTYSRHVAEALLALMEADDHRFDLYNISAGRACSLLDWGEALKEHFPDFHCRLTEPGENPSVNLHGDRDRLVMSPKRLTEDIGYVVPHDIKATARDFAAWMKRYPDYWLA